MIRKTVRYTVKQDALDQVVEAVREFVAAVRSNEPRTTYGAYRVDGGTSFLHVMSFPNDEAEQTHRSASYTESFVEVLFPRCETPPEFADLDEVATTGD